MIIQSKAIRGSVFEIELPSGIKNYVVISDNSYNANNSNCLMALICHEKDCDASNSKYHTPFTVYVGNMPITFVINGEAIFTFSQKKLKNYKYHISDDIMEKVNVNIMQLFFGKQYYTYEQMLVKREEESARMIAKYTADYHDNSDDIHKENNNFIDTYTNASIDEIQSYYASTIKDEEYISHPRKENIPDKPNKSIIFIKNDNNKEKVNNKNTKIKSTKVNKQQKKYISRKKIWEAPDEFLLDFCTLKQDDLYIKYSINNRSQCNKIREKAINKAKELNIDISFYYEEIINRGGKINI